MQNQIGFADFFQCGPKSSYQIMRQVLNEAYRIRNHDLQSVWQLQRTRRRIKRGKQLVLDIYIRMGQLPQ